MDNSLSRLMQLHDALYADAAHCQSLMQSKDTSTARRIFIRAVFDLIEGVTSGMKQVALEKEQYRKGRFTRAEVALLKQESYPWENLGREQNWPDKMTFLLKKIHSAFWALAESHRATYSLPMTGLGWKSLRIALDVRRRIMHPKSVDELTVSKEEIEYVVNAHLWFVSNYVLLLKAITAAEVKVTNITRHVPRMAGMQRPWALHVG